MSATLVWASSGNGAKTGTAVANYFDDLDTLVTSKAGDATFFWEKAGKNSAGTPYWLLLRPKSGAAGRIAIICWTSLPAANNVAILDGNPVANTVFIAYFPAGTGTTLSNLTAASGTICGDDTNCVKVCAMTTVTIVYATSLVHFYADCAEGMLFFNANPAATTTYGMGAGELVVDAADVAYGCTLGGGGISFANWGGSANPFPWSATALLAGTANGAIRTNYGAANRNYGMALLPSGAWANQAVGPNDVLTDTAINGVGFVACQLMGTLVKLGGLPLKLRQIAWGPGTVGPFTVYQLTGPVVNARQMCNQTAGATGFMWVTNTKL